MVFGGAKLNGTQLAVHNNPSLVKQTGKLFVINLRSDLKEAKEETGQFGSFTQVKGVDIFDLLK